MRNSLTRFTLSVILLAPCAMLPAQDNSSMTGVVTDPTGAVIPGAVVTLSNPSTGATFTQTTDELGSYRFPSVPAGTGYKVTFTRSGFTRAEFSDITLSVAV